MLLRYLIDRVRLPLDGIEPFARLAAIGTSVSDSYASAPMTTVSKSSSALPEIRPLPQIREHTLLS